MTLSGFTMILSIGVPGLLLAAGLSWWLVRFWRQKRFKAVALQSASILVLSAAPFILITLYIQFYIWGLRQDPVIGTREAALLYEEDKAGWTWAAFVIFYGLFIAAPIVAAVVFLTGSLAKLILVPVEASTNR
ncbi:MAG: hypothetical protein MI753_16470 [Hyphomicrobiales bacterium]|nr:hypothetical protein [Hyphomicrobiales bacterium]